MIRLFYCPYFYWLNLGQVTCKKLNKRYNMLFKKSPYFYVIAFDHLRPPFCCTA